MKKRSLRRKLREQDWKQLPAQFGYSAEALCDAWGVHRKTLARAFSEELGISPQCLFEQFRDLKAKLLAEHGVRKKEIVQLLGYKHAARLSRRLKRSAREAILLLQTTAPPQQSYSQFSPPKSNLRR